MSVAMLSARMSRANPSPTAVISDKVRALGAQGKSVINLGEGELYFDTPSHIKQAGIAAIERGDTKYTAVQGTTSLIDAIRRKFERDNHLRYERNQIIAGCGAKQLIFNAFLATIDADDEVLICAPYWVSYPDMVGLAGGHACVIDTCAEQGWKLQADALRAAIGPRTRWLVLNSPNNPTGAVYSREEIRALTDVLLDFPNVLIMADDIYELIRYDDAFFTPAQVEPRLYERVLTINGVSKSYSMTGWRLGFAAGPSWLIAAMQVLQSQSTSNPSSISQAATIAALDGDTAFLDAWRTELYAARGRVLSAIEESPGLSCAMSDGAFYAFVDCRGAFGARKPDGTRILSDFDFAEYLLESVHVGVVHGTAFGAPGYIRIAYAVAPAILEEACQRLVLACQRLELATDAAAV